LGKKGHIPTERSILLETKRKEERKRTQQNIAKPMQTLNIPFSLSRGISTFFDQTYLAEGLFTMIQ